MSKTKNSEAQRAGNDAPAQSENPAGLKKLALAQLLPEAISEGRLDVEALIRALGEAEVIEGGERYRLDWAGKSEAYKVLQTPTTATLRPQRELSVNFDSAEHVFIEGENLEVLKVLQKAYFGKVKLIYIDPPYNTGNDSFIYPDRFQESKEDYLKRINELEDDGTLMREGFFRKNSRENGHYHSNWLNMMLPRLYIARNLLRDDGVIFISCDDNEVHNLRCLMNEVFGEENFISVIVWKKSYGGGAKVKHVVILHEYVLCYARNKDRLGQIDLPPDPTTRKYYKYKDEKNELRGPYRLQPLATTSMDERENLRYPIPFQAEEIWPEKQWQWSKERTMEALANDEIVITRSGNSWSVNYKQYLRDEEGNERAAKLFSLLDGPYTQRGTEEIKKLFGNGKVFTFPKPKDLIKQFISILHDDADAIVLDFFAGSCPTAHALFEFNREYPGNRKFICIQIPEPVDALSEAGKLGYKTVAEIGRDRISKVIDEINESSDSLEKATNLAFKALILTPSNFKQWRGDGIESTDELAEQMQMFVRSEKDGAGTEDILYELLLKFGQELTTPVETLDIEGEQVFAIRDKKMLFVLAAFNERMIDAIVALKPQEVVALDSVFQDSDELKTNFDLQCRNAGIRLTCI